ERLRDLREAVAESPPFAGPALVLGAADPAQPYGAALPWPKRPGGRAPARAVGAQVVLLGGAPALYLERGGRSMLTLREPDPAWLEPALEALAAWVAADRRRRVSLERVDGMPVFESPLEPALVTAGFRPGVRDLVLRA
ncbi:MAG: ATP-dependent helicase Lhr and Lhr-like helicase, partial [Miltoncostaeaceae bacterium]|nr:ATP-dependent helicase Lhr and Lhr-like helicase [Miltoncostaeaceae bacterium]